MIKSHWNQISTLHGSNISARILHHPLLFSGYQLPGDIKQETLDLARSLSGVHSVTRSKLFKAHNVPWGLDRIDQKTLPLDGKYSADYDGSGVNVFVVDSGLDSSHTEFSHTPSGPNRVVRNLYDAYQVPGDNSVFPLNNDGVGHGTHCSGTIGGNAVGVSPGANIYGVRVLGSRGEGSDFDILGGLVFVLNWYISNGKPPTVISMSLGGDCINLIDCEDDILVQAVEALSLLGIIVVTAAGNSDCDSCLQTPAFAPHGITVGASSATDQAAYFSDFGKCIDIYAPGVNITSACGAAMCPGPLDKYVALSGTSMAGELGSVEFEILENISEI
jgi:subtilisin family serine protease